jgi:hypothetical protein
VKASYLGEVLSLSTEDHIDAEEIQCRFKMDIPGTHVLEHFELLSKGSCINSTVVQCENRFSWNRLFMDSYTQEVWSVEALSPLEHSNATLFIQITTNGEDWSNALKILLIAPERIDSIHPKTGRATGGTSIHVLGKNFVKVDTLACRFGREWTVPATFISSTHVQCTSPAMMTIGGDSIQNLSVTNNGVHFSNAIPFEYSSELVIHEFNPQLGWVSGGVAVSISFDVFLVPLNESLPWYCKFNYSLSFK